MVSSALAGSTNSYATAITILLCIPASFLLIRKTHPDVANDHRKLSSLFLGFVVFSLVSFGVILTLRAFGLSIARHQALIFFMPAWSLWASSYLNTDRLRELDALGVILPFLVSIIRLYCFSQGCCYGLEICTEPHLRVPIRELTIIWNSVTGLILLNEFESEHVGGTVLSKYLISYSCMRLIEIALWGEPNRDPYLIEKIIAIGLFVFGICLTWELEDEDRGAYRVKNSGDRKRH